MNNYLVTLGIDRSGVIGSDGEQSDDSDPGQDSDDQANDQNGLGCLQLSVGLVGVSAVVGRLCLNRQDQTDDTKDRVAAQQLQRREN